MTERKHINTMTWFELVQELGILSTGDPQMTFMRALVLLHRRIEELARALD